MAGGLPVVHCLQCRSGKFAGLQTLLLQSVGNMHAQEVPESLTLNSVSLSRVGDAISVQESVFPLEHVLDHFSHGAVIKLLLRCLRWKDL